MSECCNQNCNSGRACPFRKERDLTKWERVGFLLLGLVWAMVCVAVLTGGYQ